ncbi:MAG TPA: hypothetical protein VMN77_07710 [Nitrospiria bacterium]|jgi:hypothetical protein|nr:hypothetical protein [Nitrospiria bacterium]
MTDNEKIGRQLNFHFWILVLFVLSAIATASGAARAEESREVKADEKKLGTLDPATFVPKSLVYSSDGRHAIWLIRSQDQYQVLVDGTPGPLFDGTFRPPVFLSPDGRHAAYVVENQKDRRLSVISDQTVGPAFESILRGTPVFSPDSRHIAYAGENQEKHRVLLDGKPGPEYELVGHLSFSPDSRRFVYAAQKDKRRFVVVDGVPGPPYDDVYPTGFSPDSRHVVYYATQGKKQRIIVDDHPGPEYDGIGPLHFNPAQGTLPPSLGYIGLLGKDLIEVTQPLP